MEVHSETNNIPPEFLPSLLLGPVVSPEFIFPLSLTVSLSHSYVFFPDGKKCQTFYHISVFSY